MSTNEIEPAKMEDQVAVDLLERLNGILNPAAEAGGSPLGRAQRESIELLGLLPYALDEVSPMPGTRENLMARIRREDQPESGVEGRAEVVPLPTRTWRSWAMPLAASLMFLGLGGMVWYQTGQLEDQRLTIETLASQLSESNVQTAQLAEYEEQLQSMQEQLSLVTSRGVEVCSLRPEYAAAVETNARGTLFVASDHQHWYLRIDDLDPCPLGRSYQLWFITEEGQAIDGGILNIQKGIELEVTSDTMPQGTIAVNVTLEPAGGSTEPSGPLVLHGDEVMRIL